MQLWLGESLISIVLIVFAAAFYIISNSFPAAMNPADVGPAAFPRLMAGLTVILGLVQLFLSLSSRAKDWVGMNNKTSFLAGILLTFLYLYLFPRIGYFYVTPVFVVLLMLVLGNRKWLQLLGTAAGFTLFGYYVFYRFLQVALPV
jgi:hypothetical protein